MLFLDFCRSVFKARGWTLKGAELQRYRRAVVIAAPHTSNWDLVYMLASFDLLGLPLRFTIKKEWMRFPFNYVISPVGGVPIDRSPKTPGGQRPSMVDAMVELFEQNPGDMALVVTPEGTRSLRKQWRTGFYHVAIGAKVPILLGYLDYEKREAGVGKIVHPSGNYEADMREISAFYRSIAPKHPEKFSVDRRFI